MEGIGVVGEASSSSSQGVAASGDGFHSGLFHATASRSFREAWRRHRGPAHFHRPQRRFMAEQTLGDRQLRASA